MPVYEYQCSFCGEIDEVLILGKSDPGKGNPGECKACGGKNCMDLMTSKLGAMHFKGDGFHVNDYPKGRSLPTKTTHAVGAPEGSKK